MELQKLVEQVKSHPDIHQAGMILAHNGIVRATSRDGSPVEKIEVRADHRALDHILEEYRRKEGIVDIQAKVLEGTLHPGDDIMYLVVAGDFRENVIPVMTDLIDAVKRDVTAKREF
ncbi:MAG TPA: molybdenum cofactor biosynthesis protein MoaE [Deltaproteobacteria bacterium]|jgi:molybdopterin synthase catalytic subunit|nr:molybdenum cofactor biosynthesis protein MoaE [Deltaproteobacteria bacterium]